MTEKKEWYDNQRLYEMMVDLSKGLERTNAELARTQVLIRDYNGYREKTDECAKRLDILEGARGGSKDMWGYVVGGIGVLMALISYAVR